MFEGSHFINLELFFFASVLLNENTLSSHSVLTRKDTSEGMSASSLFREACIERGVRKPNTALLNLLFDCDDIRELEELFIEDLYLGNRTLMAFLDVVSKAKSFRKISFVSQKIYNADLSEDSVKGNDLIDHLIEVCGSHPSVTSLNLSGNPLSNFAGRKLLQLANTNERLVSISLLDTRIDFDLISHISLKCQKNLKVCYNITVNE